jgi:hypothetical protein
MCSLEEEREKDRRIKYNLALTDIRGGRREDPSCP